jgi:predicted phage terminase large subunit-like protein
MTLTTWAEAVLAEREREKLQEEAALLAGSLKRFIVGAWDIIEPGTEFLDGIHIDAICDHLEAAAAGEIPWLLISMPPGHMKSLLCSVAFPSWVWCKRPEMRVLTASYAADIARTFSIQSRSIVESDWYQARWPMALRHDVNRQDRYENQARGFRLATSVGAKLTGLGGSVFVFDDPISMDDIYSPTKRLTTNRWVDNVASTRIRNMKPGSRIMVAQRGHEADPIGHILKKGIPGLIHLNLQARFVPHKRCVTPYFTDPRTKADEPLWPALYPDERLRALERYGLTPDAFAAQFQQEPVAEGGSILKRKWWRFWTEWSLPPCAIYVISVDPSVKEADFNDPWACTVWGLFKHQEDTARADQWNMILLDAWERHLSYPAAKRVVMQTCSDWEVEGQPVDYTLIEDKASGPPLIYELQQAGVPNVTPWPPKGLKMVDKVQRARLVSDLLMAGRIWVPGKKLADKTRSAEIVAAKFEMVLKQAEMFPAGEHDDLVDTCTQAWALARRAGYLTMDSDPLDWQEADDSPRQPEAIEPYYA